MGGTTAKAGVIYHGEALTTGAALIGGYDKALPVQIAMMDIFEVGTGGGSIARVEEGGLARRPAERGRRARSGLLRPRRQLSRPSPTPISCSAGSAPTASWAARCGSTSRPPSARSTSASPSRSAWTRPRAADGILRIAATAMSYAVKGVTTERGLDAGDFALVAYGGAGPLHAVQVAREIGIRTVIVPPAPGVFSAFGMLFSDLRYDFVRTWFTRLEDASFDQIERVYRELEGQGRAAIAGTSVKPQKIDREARRRHALCRPGARGDGRSAARGVQEAGPRRRSSAHFDAMHELRYGTSAPDERAEIVSLRTHRHRRHAQAAAGEDRARQARARQGGVHRQAAGAFRRQVPADADLRRAPRLLAGNRIAGPALIEEHASTTVLLPGDKLEVDVYGNLVIAVAGGR